MNDSDKLNDLNKLNKSSAFAAVFLITSTSISCNDIGTNYEFCNYSYVIIMIQLAVNNNLVAVCLDTNCKVILIDDDFLETQFSNANVYTITISLQIEEIGLNKHNTFKYLILKMFFSEKKENKTACLVIIKWEVYIIKNLWVKMLIENDILTPEKFDFFLAKKEAYIDLTEVII